MLGQYYIACVKCRLRYRLSQLNEMVPDKENARGQANNEADAVLDVGMQHFTWHNHEWS